MGTRNLTMVQCDNKIPVAQYGQWDGYIDGAGVEIFEFVKKMLRAKKLEQFKEIVSNCYFVDRPRIREYYLELGVDIDIEHFIDIRITDKFKEKHPALDRDMGPSILDFLLENGSTELRNEITFAKDSLFCEWAYVVNLDTEMLEVYRGFQETPLEPSDRFYHLQEENSKYYPIRKTFEISFKTLYEMTNEEFVKAYNEFTHENDED